MRKSSIAEIVVVFSLIVISVILLNYWHLMEQNTTKSVTNYMLKKAESGNVKSNSLTCIVTSDPLTREKLRSFMGDVLYLETNDEKDKTFYCDKFIVFSATPEFAYFIYSLNKPTLFIGNFLADANSTLSFLNQTSDMINVTSSDGLATLSPRYITYRVDNSWSRSNVYLKVYSDYSRAIVTASSGTLSKNAYISTAQYRFAKLEVGCENKNCRVDFSLSNVSDTKTIPIQIQSKTPISYFFDLEEYNVTPMSTTSVSLKMYGKGKVYVYKTLQFWNGIDFKSHGEFPLLFNIPSDYLIDKDVDVLTFKAKVSLSTFDIESKSYPAIVVTERYVYLNLVNYNDFLDNLYFKLLLLNWKNMKAMRK